MSKEYVFFPGCCSDAGVSASHYMTSLKTLCGQLDIKLNETPDWNCCGGSLGHVGGGELPRLALSARNLALAEREHADQDVLVCCSDCWRITREARERLGGDAELLGETNQALAEAGLKLEAKQRVRHMVEVLVEDFGFEALKAKVIKPLDGIKIAGYVGTQLNPSFGMGGASSDNPLYLDKMVEAMGAVPLPDFDKKVQCCGGAQAFSEPEKSRELIKEIIEAAHDHGADMIVTPCTSCQLHLEIYQQQIAAKPGARPKMPVVYYSQMMAVAFGSSAKDAGLDGNLIRAEMLEDMAVRG